MGAFYGQVKGRSETAATRIGTKDSGIKVSAQSWDGSVIVRLHYNEDKELMVDVETSDESSSYGRTRFQGTLEELNEALESWEGI